MTTRKYITRKYIARKYIAAGLLILAGALALPARAAETRPPNVIVILADDLGYGDTGVYGSKVIRTPNIDALASDGVRFTSGYATHPVCAPSRAGLLTGRYQQRFGYEFNPVLRDRKGGVSLEETTLAEIMKSAGYATGMVGKWHLGMPDGYYPTDRGFDSYFGMASGGSNYILDPQPGDEFYTPPGMRGSTADEGEALEQRLLRGREINPITHNKEVILVKEYLTDRFTDEAVAFIEAHKSEPFFLYLAYNAPHTPLEATKKYIDRYKHVEDKGTRVYAAMVSAVDDGVGAVRAKLAAEGLTNDTLIFFLSDNGCASYVDGACSNAPLAGFKGEHLEGGIRVPYIIAWPGHVAGGRTDDRPVSTLDVVPTAASIAGAELLAGRIYDGVDLMPYLTGAETDAPNPALYWRAGENFAIRDGNWKMWIAKRAPASVKMTSERNRRIAPPAEAGPQGQVVMLYDLEKDLGETTNLAETQADVVARLKQSLDAWNATLAAPQWPSERQFYLFHQGEALHLFD